MDFDSLNGYRYCFLNAVYTADDDSNKAFCVVLADDDFRQIAAVHVDIDTLKQFAKRFQITDFDFSDGYFKCNPHVLREKYNELMERYMNHVVTEEHDSYTFFDLLYEGQQNGFCVINDEFVHEFMMQKHSSTAAMRLDAFENAQTAKNDSFYYLSHFRMIQFSQSSMTAYVRMRNKEGCYNKMLVIPVNHVPKLQKFYFVVPDSYGFHHAGCDFIQKINLDGKSWLLYAASLLSIYEINTILSGPLVNKAISLRQRCSNACEALSSFRREMWISIYEGNSQEDRLKWVGGQNSYNENCGVYFKSSMKSLTKKDRDRLCRKVVDELVHGGESFENFKEKLMHSHEGNIEKYVCMSVALALEYSVRNEGIDLLEAVSQVINSQRDKQFLCDLYLYHIRLYLYISGETLTAGYAPIVYGGNETAFTIVDGGRYYGTS